MLNKILTEELTEYLQAEADIAKAIYPYGNSFFYQYHGTQPEFAKELWAKLFATVKKAEEENKNLEEIEKEVKLAVKRYLDRNKTGERIGYHLIEKDEYLPMPYEEIFHEHFTQRKISYMKKIDIEGITEYEQLFGLIKNKYLPGSQNAGNFNHFMNVILVCAHLIKFFSIRENAEKLGLTEASANKILPDFTFSSRNLRLLFGAYLHDIAKCIGPDAGIRHAHRGAFWLFSANEKARENFSRIYHAYGCGFHETDMRILGTFTRFHDAVGVSSTGEAPVSILAKLAHDFASLSVFDADSTAALIFDHFILSAADIIASVVPKNKFEPFEEFAQNACGNKITNQIISDFFNDLKGKELIEDVILTLKLGEEACEYAKVPKANLLSTESGSMKRLRRLAQSSAQSIKKSDYANHPNLDFKQMIEELDNALFKNEKQIYANIIQVITGFEKPLEKLSRIGQIDYFLGFIARMFEVIIKQMLEEYNGTNTITSKWITVPADTDDKNRKAFLAKNNAERILQNYLATLITITNEIYKAMPAASDDETLNVEFVFVDRTLAGNSNLLNALLQWASPVDESLARSTLISQSVMFYH